MKDVPNFSSITPSPSSSVASNSSASYHVHAVGIRRDNEIFSFLNRVFTSSVVWTSVLNLAKFISPTLEVFILRLRYGGF